MEVYIYPISALIFIPLSIFIFFILKGFIFKYVKGNNLYKPNDMGLKQFVTFQMPEFTFNETEYPDMQVYKRLKLMVSRALEQFAFLLVVFGVLSGVALYLMLNDHGI